MSELEDSAEELINTVRSLDESIRHGSDLRDELTELTRRSNVTRRMLIFVVTGFLLDVVLTIAMALVGAQAVHNSDRINDVVQKQHDGALCPLYQIFIQSDTPANRDRAASQGQDMDERARQFVIIRRSYDALKCQAK